jgi:N-hydroxyarylamine O-acetyltransferase
MIDLDAYFARIGYRGSRQPTLETLHALSDAHVRSIPFENIDVLLGRSIDLALPAIERKLVHDRRGGYCFEQNTLFLAVLQELGFCVRPLSARVRYQRPREFTPPRTHVCLRVELDEPWLADVGVGGLSLTSALRLASHEEQRTRHELRRLLREDGVIHHQVRFGDAWHDVCELTLEEMPEIDRVVANWYTSTHPGSHFKQRLLVARAERDGARITLADRELTLRPRDGEAERHTLASHDELVSALFEHFSIRLPAGTRVDWGDAWAAT